MSDGPFARLEVRRADITRLQVDAIVNAANELMLGGGGVDGAIHRAAGPGLLQECRAVAEIRPGVRCPTGEARITGGHDLPCRYVIHTVGPVWRGGGHGEPELLASCYRSALRLAADNGISTVAFPAISCGVFGYPIDRAAAVAVAEVAAFLRAEPRLQLVILTAFDQVIENALTSARDELRAATTRR